VQFKAQKPINKIYSLTKMLLNLFHRLRAQFRSQRPLRPLQIFQLILIYILALVVSIRALIQLV